MAVHWTIDSRTRLLVAVAEGGVGLSDLERLLNVIAGARAVGFRKLFDGTRGKSQMTADEQLAIGVRLRALHERAGDGLGPVAMVVRDENYLQVGRVLGILAIPKRPMRMFKQADKARAWLDAPAIMASAQG